MRSSLLGVIGALALLSAQPAFADGCPDSHTTSALVYQTAVGKPFAYESRYYRIPGCDEVDDPMTFTIDWGDGTIDPATVTTDSDDPRWMTIRGTHTYTREMTAQLLITERNDRTGRTFVDDRKSVQVLPRDCSSLPTTTEPRSVRGAAGKPVTLDVPWYRVEGCEEPGDPLSFTVDWGDGTHSEGTIVPDPGDQRRLTVHATHTYARPVSQAQIVVTERNGRNDVTRSDRHYVAEICSCPARSRGSAPRRKHHSLAVFGRYRSRIGSRTS